MSINIVVVLTFDTGMKGRFRSLLDGLASRTREEVGCERFEVYGCAEKDDEIVLVEQWQNRDAISSHMREEYTASFIREADGIIVSTQVRTLLLPEALSGPVEA